MRVCNVPGCPELTKSGRCAEHRKGRRPSARAQGYNAKWERTRREYIDFAGGPDSPCEHCGKPAGPSPHVHHVDGLGPSGPHGHDFFNLELLCVSCHSRITARETGAGGGRAA